MKNGLPVSPDDLRRRVNANLDFPMLLKGLVSGYEELLVASHLQILPSTWNQLDRSDRAQLIGWDRVRRLVDGVVADTASAEREREMSKVKRQRAHG